MNIDDTGPTRFFVCKNQSCISGEKLRSVSMYYGTAKCQCGSLMDTEVTVSSTSPNEVGRRLFALESASFILSDDLQMMPDLVGSCYAVLNNLGFDGTHEVEDKIVVFGVEEVMYLLKRSLISKTPLSDVICRKTKMSSITVNSEFCSLIGKNGASSTSKKLTLKAIVQKSTGKILLAQTTEDFVDFLFCVLTIPLGRVFSLLGGDFSFGSMHNIFGSLARLNNNRYLKYLDPFSKPYMPINYHSQYMLFPVVENFPKPRSYYNNKNGSYLSYNYLYVPVECQTFCGILLKDPKGEGSYMKGPTTYTLSDDLVVKPMSAFSGFSALNSLKIPIRDIEEQVIDIGMEEALSILKASPISKSALSNGLKHFLRKQPKEESKLLRTNKVSGHGIVGGATEQCD